MRLLSIDLEATGLEKDAYIIEFALTPIDTGQNKIYEELSFHTYIKCPSFNTLKPDLNPWVIKNNENLINKAHNQGIELSTFKNQIEGFLKSNVITPFKESKTNNYVILGKSLNSIDIPFLNRDLGWDFIKENFHHQVVDVSSVVRFLISLKILPPSCISGSELSKHLGFGPVDHTALEDAILTAKIYFKLLDLIKR